jgi:hypothetical protein
VLDMLGRWVLATHARDPTVNMLTLSRRCSSPPEQGDGKDGSVRPPHLLPIGDPGMG